eukprot:gene30181-37350_t
MSKNKIYSKDEKTRRMSVNYVEMKTIADENITKINKYIQRYEFAGDARANGIGMKGGHIAREQRTAGYICLLLGLQPTWQAARTALFKEMGPFQKFLKEIEPLTMPLRRLQKSVTLRSEKMQNLNVKSFELIAGCVCKVM